MAILPIVVAPDPRLKTRADEVDAVTDTIRDLMYDMLETMYNASGVGLAAPQVSVLKRVIVANVSYLDENGHRVEGKPLMLANPVITSFSDDLFTYDEGCLSVPGFFEERARPNTITVSGLNENNEPVTHTVSGLMSFCIQHEVEHLDGILFIDHLSRLKRERILKKLTKEKKAGMHPEKPLVPHDHDHHHHHADGSCCHHNH